MRTSFARELGGGSFWPAGRFWGPRTPRPQGCVTAILLESWVERQQPGARWGSVQSGPPCCVNVDSPWPSLGLFGPADGKARTLPAELPWIQCLHAAASPPSQKWGQLCHPPRDQAWCRVLSP